jgi:hypothetical protein
MRTRLLGGAVAGRSTITNFGVGCRAVTTGLNVVWAVMRRFGGLTHPSNRGPGDLGAQASAPLVAHNIFRDKPGRNQAVDVRMVSRGRHSP